MLNKEYEKMTFDDLDLKNDLKKRGVDDTDKLTYYPYRDDGILLYEKLDEFADAYIDAYYDNDQEVTSDNELQELVNELSADGKQGDFGGKGMVKKFPAKIEDKATLRKVLTTLLWAFTGQHAAVTYPILEYGGFVPNAPHRLFADSDGTSTFSNNMFGNKAVALEIAELSSNVAGIHLDQLLDYSEKVEGKKGQVVIEKMFKELKTLTDDILKANDKRVQQGFLPYPYFLPEFICNSAST
ncbi:PREDICTED: allene oxide synthase-lipoxygenase protein-like [Acropora digitifera]|uniref:allene oxide synthase-lipoxygenase protein-like n=1 Tax=Acropora digitifera TaxID=70779 RepID=UPI00077ADB65|nr:PREDICTED: allene oxide synthase-lipoxygenase protein-like [Acropora digitifera]